MTDIEARLRAEGARWRRAHDLGEPTPAAWDRTSGSMLVSWSHRTALAVAGAVVVALGILVPALLGHRDHPSDVVVRSGPVPLAPFPLLTDLVTTPEADFTGTVDGVSWQLKVKENATTLPTNQSDGMSGKGLCETDTWGSSSGGTCWDPAQERTIDPWWMTGADPAHPDTVFVAGATSTGAATIEFTSNNGSSPVETSTLSSPKIPGLRFFVAAVPRGVNVTTTLVALDATGAPIARTEITPGDGPSYMADLPGDHPMWPIDPASRDHFASALAAAESFADEGLGLHDSTVAVVGHTVGGTILSISAPEAATPIGVTADDASGSWTLSRSGALRPDGQLALQPSGGVRGPHDLTVDFEAPPGAVRGTINDLTDVGLNRGPMSAAAIRAGEVHVPGNLQGPYYIILYNQSGKIVDVQGLE